MSADGGRQRHFFGIARADDRVAANARFGEMRKIVSDAAHRARAERLDAGRFERVEHRARVDIDRRDPGVKRRVMIAQPKRRRIRRAARFGDQPRLERRPGRRHARRLARCRRDCRKRT